VGKIINLSTETVYRIAAVPFLLRRN